MERRQRRRRDARTRLRRPGSRGRVGLVSEPGPDPPALGVSRVGAGGPARRPQRGERRPHPDGRVGRTRPVLARGVRPPGGALPPCRSGRPVLRGDGSETPPGQELRRRRGPGDRRPPRRGRRHAERAPRRVVDAGDAPRTRLARAEEPAGVQLRRRAVTGQRPAHHRRGRLAARRPPPEAAERPRRGACETRQGRRDGYRHPAGRHLEPGPRRRTRQVRRPERAGPAEGAQASSRPPRVRLPHQPLAGGGADPPGADGRDGGVGRLGPGRDRRAGAGGAPRLDPRRRRRGRRARTRAPRGRGGGDVRRADPPRRRGAAAGPHARREGAAVRPRLDPRRGRRAYRRRQVRPRGRGREPRHPRHLHPRHARGPPRRRPRPLAPGPAGRVGRHPRGRPRRDGREPRRRAGVLARRGGRVREPRRRCPRVRVRATGRGRARRRPRGDGRRRGDRRGVRRTRLRVGRRRAGRDRARTGRAGRPADEAVRDRPPRAVRRRRLRPQRAVVDGRVVPA